MSGLQESNGVRRSLNVLLSKDAFARIDDSDDKVFYARDRFVEHLDALALSTVERIIGDLVVEENPVILDLMAGWDSHIPEYLHACRVVGLGLNDNELQGNKALTDRVFHDLNENPELPFQDDTFDVVVNTVSVDYMTRPFHVFREVSRVLKPGGLFLVMFSNRMFPQKAVKIWKESGEKERIMLVEDFFRTAEGFEEPRVFISKGRPRPKDDKYAHLGIPSDPIYAVYAEKKGSGMRRQRPALCVVDGSSTCPETVQQRLEAIKETFNCPHCGERLRKWAVPISPFSNWDTEFMYICFNDACCYLLKGWEVMGKQGNRGFSYRFMYDADHDNCMPVPVPTLDALKEGIVD